MTSFDPLRVVVVGLSGSGKTTFATQLAEATGLAQIELDLLNWRPGWYDRYVHEHEAFRADVANAIAGEAWVLAGGYSKVRPMVFARANTLVWLDLPKALVMRQVLWRSIQRATDGKLILNGNRETFDRWFKKGHPIGIVWNHYGRKSAAIEAQLATAEAAHLRVYRCTTRKQASATLAELSRQKARPF